MWYTELMFNWFASHELLQILLIPQDVLLYSTFLKPMGTVSTLTNGRGNG